jgi:hypothetical protein
MADDRDNLMRNLGKFVGAIWHGIRTDPARHEVRRTVEEHEGERDGQSVVIRRTTIDEVEIQNKPRSS